MIFRNEIIKRNYVDLFRSVCGSFMSIALIFAFILFSCERPVTEPLKEGGTAPHFSLPDLKGNTVDIADHTGEPIILEFWATWCPPCIDSIPELNELYRYLRGKDGLLITVNVDEGTNRAGSIADFVSEHNISYPVLLGDEHITHLYGIMNIPALFLFNKEHRLVKRYIGPVPFEELEHDMEGLL